VKVLVCDEGKKVEDKKASCALAWKDVEKVGDKWHVPSNEKEKGLQAVQYSECKGIVSLRGCLISEGEAAEVAFTLPAECAPKKALRFNSFFFSGKKSSPSFVVISPDGNVTVSSTGKGEFWFSGISFDH